MRNEQGRLRVGESMFVLLIIVLSRDGVDALQGVEMQAFDDGCCGHGGILSDSPDKRLANACSILLSADAPA
jgi:hypothetical protein